MLDKKPAIQALERALDILEMVRDADAPLRNVDIAERAGLSPATAGNIVRALFRRGYLAQDDGGRYLVGAEGFKLAARGLDAFEPLRRVVKEPVEALARDTGDTSFFGCEYFGSLYCVSLARGGAAVVVNLEQQWLERLHCTAAGKIIVAERGAEWYARLCRRRPPRAFTERTIIEAEAMTGEIESIRARGYSLSVDECAVGVAALGVAVRDAAGGFAGALAQSFPTQFLDDGRLDPDERSALLHLHAGRLAPKIRP